MAITLEYVGSFHPWDQTHGGITATVQAIRTQHPGIEDPAVERILQGILDRREEKRVPGHIIHRFGADIMTADLTTVPAWRWVAPLWQQKVPMMPLTGGAMLQGASVDVQRMAFFHGNPADINRASLIAPAGLAHTYVWRRETDWLQDVTDADVAVLRAAKDAVFRDPAKFGRWVEPRAWMPDPNALRTEPETFRFTNEDDMHAFERDRQRVPHWAGTATPALAGKE